MKKRKHRKHVCRKWNHDFSYTGKKTPSQINCQHCGKNIVEWANEMSTEYEKKLYGYGNEKRVYKHNVIETKLPPYAQVKGKNGNLFCAIRKDGDKSYWRDAGEWGANIKVVGCKMLITGLYDYGGLVPIHKHLNGVELLECSNETWRKDNEGYI